MKMLLRQKLWLAIVVAVNAALWIIPSNVVADIARDEQTMLGRYSRTHFAWNLGVLLVSVVTFHVDCSTGPTQKRRRFQVIATGLFLFPALAIIDLLLRTPETMHYVRDSLAYHRPVNAEFEETFADKPRAYRTYPNAKPGFGTVHCVGRTDRNGYRNRSILEQYDIITLGDSFTEGSKVSDEHPWPVRLASISGKSVCNLGMSGYDPFHYLASLREVGLGLKPRVVLCLLYEGNDFRSTKSDAKRANPSLSKRLADYVDRSPLIKAIDRLVTETFAPMRSNAPLVGAGVLDWLPLAIPPGPGEKYYAFEPKQLRDLLQSREEFSGDRHWHNPRGQIAEMNRLCADAGSRFVLLFAPTKAHVVLPLVADQLDAERVRAFTAIDYKKVLPAAATFKSDLLSRLDSRESVVADWCAEESIPFFSLTKALRDALAAGQQTYYTYDQHWTPVGHEVVGRAIFDFLVNHSILDRDEVSVQ